MILFDTSVILDALDRDSGHFEWASGLLIEAASGDGAAVNAVTVAELCAGDRDPESVEADLLNWEVQVLDVPAAAAAICGKAHRRYAIARRASGGGTAPKIPLPDFFIGAHAEIMRWKLAARDTERISKY
ncbi:MAG: type II toxin-antitoxin system VapC family toxin, partial [Limisphaerales bacterium]